MKNKVNRNYKFIKIVIYQFISLSFIQLLKNANKIIFVVDVSLKRQKKVLMQLIKNTRYLLRYESEIQSRTKKKYDANKKK